MVCRLLGAKPLSEPIQAFSFKKMHVKMSYAKWRLFCFGLNMSMCYKEGKDALVTEIFDYLIRYVQKCYIQHVHNGTS